MTAQKLNIGDTIGIICPCHVLEQARYKPFLDTLKRLGFRVKTGRNVEKSTYGYLATEQERADDLNEMVLDEEVKMILFGGGEGANELLPYIDFENIKAHPKLFCSYSDGTTILDAIYSRTGLITYYGQSPGNFGNLSHYDYTQFTSHFCQAHPGEFKSNSQWITCHGGVCEGTLIGGYTDNVALLLGGDYFSFDTQTNYMLFLEDYEKYGDVAKVSARISHIEQSCFIRQVGGLLFGHYSQNVPQELLARLERFGKKYNVPVVYCDDFGHGVNHAVLPIGGKVVFDADKKTMQFC